MFKINKYSTGFPLINNVLIIIKAEAQRIRMKTQLEKLQSEISVNARLVYQESKAATRIYEGVQTSQSSILMICINYFIFDIIRHFESH